MSDVLNGSFLYPYHHIFKFMCHWYFLNCDPFPTGRRWHHLWTTLKRKPLEEVSGMTMPKEERSGGTVDCPFIICTLDVMYVTGKFGRILLPILNQNYICRYLTACINETSRNEGSFLQYLPLFWPVWQSRAALEHNLSLSPNGPISWCTDCYT